MVVFPNGTKALAKALEVFEEEPKMKIDRVCGKEVEETSGYQIEYDGITYDFCSYDCRVAFAESPDSYIEGNVEYAGE